MPVPLRFFATCAKGTEGALRRELSALRLHAVRGDRGGVSFEGKLEAGMRACLHARTAMRVLLELAQFDAPDPDALYAGAHVRLEPEAGTATKGWLGRPRQADSAPTWDPEPFRDFWKP